MLCRVEEGERQAEKVQEDKAVTHSLPSDKVLVVGDSQVRFLDRTFSARYR